MQSEHGSVTADKTECEQGKTVTLTVTPDSNYVLSELTVNGTETQVTNGKATFKMPAENVTVNATFLEFGVYAINIAKANNITVTADKTTAKKEEKVTLTVNVDYGYTLTSLKMNDTALTVTDGKAEFTMPEGAVNITAQTAKAANIKTGAAGEYQISFDSMVAARTATAYVTAEYGDDGITVKAYVEDERIIAEKDGLELYFGKNGYAYAKLSDANIGVKITADGNSVLYAADASGYAEADSIEGLTVVTASPWAKADSVDGYYIEVKVTYAALGFADKAAAQDNITVLPVLNNYSGSMGEAIVYNGYKKNNPGTYPVIEGSKWVENYYASGVGTLGGVSFAPAGNLWDLSKDYAVEDTENYHDREVTLSGHDNIDNNLVFYRSRGESVYAEATFTVTGIYKEGWGKFGLMLFDGSSKQGMFLYADANTAGNFETTDIADIKGTSVGYVPANGADFVWANDSNIGGKFSYDRPITLKMAYDGENDIIYFWCVDGDSDLLLGRSAYEASGDVVIGIKSFAIGLKVTNYFSTNDTENELYKAHIQKVVASSGAFGKTSNMIYGSKWDLEKDYPASDENYAEREVKLIGHDGNDNNLFFKDTEGKSAYVRATFTLNEVFGDEKFGKFGFMMFDGEERHGTFFYVDSNIVDGNFVGTALGYNYAPNGWGAWGSLGNGLFNLTTKTITLAMAYDADSSIINMYYVNDKGEDVLLRQQPHAHTNNKFVIGIKSFAYGITVTDYIVNTDKESDEFKAHNPAIIKRNIDTLFAGDSYMEFWKLYGLWDTLTADLPDKLLENVGVGGTQVPFWDNDGQTTMYSLMYNPKQIVFHIGVNDIDGGTSVSDTVERIKGLFTSYHNAFPQAQLYWVCMIPNNFYIKKADGQALQTTYNADYKQANIALKAYMEDIDYVTYIDVETAFTAEDGGAKTAFLKPDGLHLSEVYGYPLWTGIIKQALGYTQAGENDTYLMGNTATNKATPAWTYGTNGNIAEINRTTAEFGNKVNVEESIYYKADPATDLLFEAEIRSSGRFNTNDAWSKVGVMLAGEHLTVFAFLETNTGGDGADGANTHAAALVVRPAFHGDDIYALRQTGIGDWVWDASVTASIAPVNVRTDYIKVGIAKRGTTVYLLINGKVVAQKSDIKLQSVWNDAHNGYGYRYIDENVITADTKFTAGVMTFSRNVEIKSVNYLNVASEIDYFMAAERNITVNSYSGTTVTIDDNKTVAKRGDSISFAVATEDVILDKVFVTYGGADHELTLEDGKYTFVMPDSDVTIKLTFKGLKDITLGDGVAEKITASTLSVVEGGKVTFTAKPNWYISKLYADEVEIMGKDGVFELTVTDNVNITGEFFAMYDGFILDGVLDSGYGSTSTEALMSDNRNMQVWAKKTDNGVVIYAMSHSNMYKDNNEDVGAWFDNSNFEFYLNNGPQRFINSRNYTSAGNITNFVTSYKQINDDKNKYNGKWENIYEIYIAKDLIPGFDNGDIQLNYAFKTGNGIDMAAHHSNFTIRDAASKAGYDWWANQAFGACAIGRDWYIGFNKQNQKPANLFITDSGIAEVTATATDATIDGVLDDTAWQGKQAITVGNGNASFVVNGFAGSDGLYLSLVITHGAWSPAVPSGDWSTHDNVELNINGANAPILFIDGRLAVGAFYDQAVAKTETVDGKLVTTVELFVHGVNAVYRIQMGCNGDGFKGWQSLIWDANNAFVTANGIALNANPFESLVAKDGVVMDGQFTESVWTDEVKAKTYTTQANGATVSVMGVNADSGIMLGFTVVHTKEEAYVIQGNGLEWWNFLNVEFRLMNRGHVQIAVSVWNNGAAGCFLGRKTVENGDGTYTTTFEIFVEYIFIGAVKGEPIAVAMGGVFETGFSHLFGANWNDTGWTNSTHYITDKGMIAY